MNSCLQIQTTDHLLKIALMNPNSTDGKQETEKTNKNAMIILIPLYMFSNELHLPILTPNSTIFVISSDMYGL